MAPILTTTEVVVTRIAAKCTFVDERGGVGIRLEPAAAIVHQMASNSARCGVNGGPVRETSASAAIGSTYSRAGLRAGAPSTRSG